jgi:hypothetical protein
MLRKFLSETNDSLVRVWDIEEGVNPLREETTNIANAKLSQLIKSLRAAIDSGDRKSEDRINKEIKKEMGNLAKPIMKDFNSAFNKFLKDQEKILENKYGVDVEFFQDGKPAISFGTQDYAVAAKAGFSTVLAVNPPDVSDTKSSPEGGGEAMDYGFDLTHFDKPANFEKLLKMVGAKGGERGEDGFEWTGPGITIVTGNNPITGEYFRGNRGNDPGYASYIGLTGDPDKVKKAAAYIKKFDPKDESPGRRSFI